MQDAAAEAAFRTELIPLIPHMRAFARSLCRDPSQAEDLAQDALAKAWAARASYTPGTNLKAWTFMILRNCYYSETRRSWRSSALDPQAKPAYEAALALVNAHQYDRALDALASFLVKYPDHPYADNAMYWRGECYFAKGDYLHASEQFEGTVTRFPAGNKAPDALLKLGMSRMKLGDPGKAREYFDRLAHAYPQSEAARHIPTVFTSATTPHGAGSEDHR